MTGPILKLLSAASLLGLAACGDNSAIHNTLDGKPAMVAAHRGASGYLPEETLEAYAMAIELGADAIEPDVVSTKDGVLIERPQQYNGKYKIPTIQEIIDLVKRSGRSVALYPETKNPTFHRQLGLPLEDKLLELLTAAGWTGKNAPVFVQSFEPGSLKYMRSKGSQLKMIQLIDADDVDLKTGALTYAAPYDRPFDWKVAGDTRLFSDMVTPAGLAQIKTYADGIGPWKRYIVSVKGTVGANGSLVDVNGDGKINEADTSTMTPGSLVKDAHNAGLLVHPYTFRNEKRRLAIDYKGDPKLEYKQFFALGIDGLFSDFADTALAARTEFLREKGL